MVCAFSNIRSLRLQSAYPGTAVPVVCHETAGSGLECTDPEPAYRMPPVVVCSSWKACRGTARGAGDLSTIQQARLSSVSGRDGQNACATTIRTPSVSAYRLPP